MKNISIIILGALLSVQNIEANTITPLINNIANTLQLKILPCEKNCSQLASDNLKKKSLIHQNYKGFAWNKRTKKDDLPIVSSTFYITGGKNSRGRDCLISVNHRYTLKRNKKLKLESTYLEVTTMPLISSAGEIVSSKKAKEKKDSLKLTYSEGRATLLEGNLSVTDYSLKAEVNYGYRECTHYKEDWLGRESCKRLGKLQQSKVDCSIN